VFSTCYGSAAENESYLRSHSFAQIFQPLAEAEGALMRQAEELFVMSGDNGEQGQAIDDALYALRALSNCFEPSTREIEAA
jgi:hypothetical protein